MDKETVIRNFSRYAIFYDRYANIQRQTAWELLGEIKEKKISKILEIGCGTGNYTLLLRDKYKNAELKAIDISKEMIEVAKEKLKDRVVEFIVADAERKDLDESFDLITSNACFQWFEDLEGSLLKYKNLLNKKGVISFSIFGPLTFWELDSSLKDISGKISIEAARFKTPNQIKRILKINFKKIKIKETRYEESFPRLIDLFNKIKYTGIRGDGLGAKIYFGRRFLSKLEDTYLNKFTRIKATYQVFFYQGLKA